MWRYSSVALAHRRDLLIYGHHGKGATATQRGRRTLHLETNCRSTLYPNYPLLAASYFHLYVCMHSSINIIPYFSYNNTSFWIQLKSTSTNFITVHKPWFAITVSQTWPKSLITWVQAGMQHLKLTNVMNWWGGEYILADGVGEWSWYTQLHKWLPEGNKQKFTHPPSYK